MAATERIGGTGGELDALARQIAAARGQLLGARTRMLQNRDREMAALDALHARIAAVLGGQTGPGAARTSAVAEEFRALKDRLRAVIVRLDGHFGF